MEFFCYNYALEMGIEPNWNPYLSAKRTQTVWQTEPEPNRSVSLVEPNRTRTLCSVSVVQECCQKRLRNVNICLRCFVH